MATEFDNDLARLRGELTDTRSEFIAVVGRISDSQLDVARRGGWSVRRVLEHVITSEEGYARVVAHLKGNPITEPSPDALPSSVEDAKTKLSSARDTLLRALDGVNEDAFYALQHLGKEEYSIVSVLENVVSHDHEHNAQLLTTLQQAVS